MMMAAAVVQLPRFRIDVTNLVFLLFAIGCFDALTGIFKHFIVIAGCVMLGIAVIELLGMSMACVLCCGIKRSYAAV